MGESFVTARPLLLGLGGLYASATLLSALATLVQHRRGRQSDLLTRALTLGVLTLVLLGTGIVGGVVFGTAMALMAGLMARELGRALALARQASPDPTWVLTIAIPATATWRPAAMPAVTVLVLAALGVLALRRAADGGSFPAIWAGDALTLLVAGVGPAVVIAIRAHGLPPLLFTFVVVQFGDLGGLFGGRAFGGTPLAPRLSPKKTWEGLLSGLLVAAGGAGLVHATLGAPSLPVALALAGALTVAGLVGDLLASGIKRAAGLDDFGRLLPGHGGLLDRADSLMVAAPAAWLALGLWEGAR
ncbi:MAG: phosphatidate cytidylyltransferase [Myxococcota bacterium]